MVISGGVNTVGTVAAAFKRQLRDPGKTIEPVDQGQQTAAPATAVPSFITPASLVSVSGGTAAVAIIWQVAKTLFGHLAMTPVVPFVISLLVGGAIYLISTGDKHVKMSSKEKAVGLFIAFVNSLVLFNAALGLTSGSH
jgi:hypothetical protein